MDWFVTIHFTTYYHQSKLVGNENRLPVAVCERVLDEDQFERQSVVPYV